MSNKFLEAAASYYGLDGLPRRFELLTVDGTPMLVLELVLTDEDMAGIVARMQTMKADAIALQAQQDYEVNPPSDARMRDEYNAMDKHAKSEFGSFSRYKAWRLGQAQEAVEVPAHVWLTSAECSPQQRATAVGMDEKGRYAIAPEDLTTAQRRMHGLEPDPYAARPADEVGAKGPAAFGLPDAPHKAAPPEVRIEPVPPEGATRVWIGEGVPTADDMRAEYVARTMAAHGRLNGDDGKPTSNADDFGGLPG